VFLSEEDRTSEERFEENERRRERERGNGFFSGDIPTPNFSWTWRRQRVKKRDSLQDASAFFF